MRRITVVTGSRSDYGLLKGIMKIIDQHPSLELNILVTGMHFSPTFGSTINEIKGDGFSNLLEVKTLGYGDSPTDIANSIARGIQGSAEILSKTSPDLLLLMGDRYETFAVGIAALNLRIPIAHIHGGEVTKGLIDEAIRHSLTNMSHFHFVANDTYRNRVIQLGEDPERVQVVGGLGIDQIHRVKSLGKNEIEKRLRIQFRNRNLLVTFHPVTLEPQQSKEQFSELLIALQELTETSIIITFPNADQESLELIEMAKEFASLHNNVYLFDSLGQELYYSILPHIDGLVGNSSSGLLEAPSFRIGTVNIGIRQAGRLKSSSVIDCDPDRISIRESLNKMFSTEFKSTLNNVANVNGEPGASDKIVNTLLNLDLDGILIKHFYDLEVT